jgi:zinc transporter ZupT
MLSAEIHATMIQAILLRTTIATVMAYLGGALGAAWGGMTAQRLPRLVYAAMGVLLAVTVCDVLPDAKSLLSWPAFGVSVLSGFALFWAISRYVYHLCPACALGAFDSATMERLGRSVILLMVAVGLHSTMDGVAVAVADEFGKRANLGVLMAVSLHKLPEGLALTLLLIGAGYTRRTAFLWTLAIEATTEIGGLLGIFALHRLPPMWLGILFGHVGGGFLYLAASTLGLTGGGTVRRPLLLSGGLAFTLTAAVLWTISLHFH